MSENGELERWRRRRIAEAMRRLHSKEAEAEREKKGPKRVLSRVLVGRAWEVLEAAEGQYPEATRRIEEGLARLVSRGELKGSIHGEQLLWFLRYLGMKVRPKMHIYVLEHGELKTIGEKMREGNKKLHGRHD